MGAFGQATTSLRDSGHMENVKRYIASGRPYFGICIGMQVLFESSDESPGAEGLGVIPFPIRRFTSEPIASSSSSARTSAPTANGKGKAKAVPQIGWNRAWRAERPDTAGPSEDPLMLDEDYYFVHSYGAMIRSDADAKAIRPYAYTLSRYGDETFCSSVKYRNVFALQFHPEKSGPAGLDLLRRWLEAPTASLSYPSSSPPASLPTSSSWQATDPNPSRRSGTGLTNRIVACLDVRSNDAGDLVVTKGDQYDVREKSSKHVRNLGKPVELARKYYEAGADEVCFLNITSFRSSALLDQPMLEVVRAAAETVFVPLTVGGGIKDTVDPDGTARSALEVAGAYFRSGADKVSIGSDAVVAVQEMNDRIAAGQPALTGLTGIETISTAYGSQAVVVSIDPRRVYVDTSAPDWLERFPAKHRASLVIGDQATSRTREDEKGQAWWYACTTAGGRTTTDMDVVELARGVELLGAGEILLNSVDRDGSGKGFDLDLINLVKGAVGIPVVSSSGAGAPGDFTEVFAETGTEAALAAGIFHRGEVGIDEVKQELERAGMPVRRITLEI